MSNFYFPKFQKNVFSKSKNYKVLKSPELNSLYESHMVSLRTESPSRPYVLEVYINLNNFCLIFNQSNYEII